MNASRQSRCALALLLVLILLAGLSTAFAADGDSTPKDPSFATIWGKYEGGFPVTVTVANCKKLNLRYEANLNGEIATTVANGAQLTATGLVGKMVQLEVNGKVLYGFGSYLVPTGEVKAAEAPKTYVTVREPGHHRSPYNPYYPYGHGYDHGYDYGPNNGLICGACGQIFYSHAAIQLHSAFAHPATQSFACSDCTGTFATQEDLDAHIAAQHSAPPVVEPD